jgi:diadenosine tetraphosphate (Ap4A) HIT family hydrolase
MNCVLCEESGGTVLWQDEFCRVILAGEADYPGLCRVILNRHAKEMTDLSSAEQTRLFSAVMAVEAVVRAIMAPDKINLASLGNVVPHLHWHVIPRYADDKHFPDPIWGQARRDAARRFAAAGLEDALRHALREKLT